MKIALAPVRGSFHPFPFVALRRPRLTGPASLLLNIPSDLRNRNAVFLATNGV